MAVCLWWQTAEAGGCGTPHGGKRAGDGDGFSIALAIFTDVPETARIARVGINANGSGPDHLPNGLESQASGGRL